MKITINGWEYQIYFNDKQGTKIPNLKIYPNNKDTIPLTLSKYYSLNKNNVHALINSQFYVSQPENLNDLFDSHLDLIDFSNHKFSDIEALFLEGQDRNEEFAKFEKDKPSYLESIKNTLYGIWNSLFGILSMTEDKYNDLMWAHYTNNSGFLVEFNYKIFNSANFFGPYPINYLPKLESIDFSKIEKNLGFFIVSLIKKKLWSYEKEFRFLCLPDIKNNFKVFGKFSNQIYDFDNQDRLVSYPKSAIVKLILGFNFYSEDIIETIGHREYFVNFKNDNAFLKITLFNKIINDKIPVEICYQNKITFHLGSIPIEITFINGSIFKVKELRNIN